MYKELDDYKKVNNFKWLLMIFIEYWIIILAITSSIYIDNVFYYLLVIIIIWNRMEIIDEVVNHQALHYTLFSNKKNNELDILFLPFFTTFKSYQKIHLNHHINVWKYKDIHVWLSREIYKIIDNPKNINSNKFYKFYLFIIRPLCWFFVFWTLKYIFSQINIFSKDLQKLKILIFWFLLIILWYFFNFLLEILLYWIIPFIYTRPIFFFYTAVAQHYWENKYWTYNFDWFLSKYILSSYWENWHWLHHYNMYIPCYNLEKFNKSEFNKSKDLCRKINIFSDFKYIIFK